MKLIIGITGSTGVIYGIRMLEILKKLNIKTYLIMTDWASKCISLETIYKIKYVQSLSTEYFSNKNLAASISSGTYKTDGMIIIPCTMKTLSSIAYGHDETLISRSANVILKESKKLVLVTRETPLTAINLENMLKLAMLGIVILPPMIEFYTKPKSITDIIDHGIGKCLDQFNIEHNLYPRWGKKI